MLKKYNKVNQLKLQISKRNRHNSSMNLSPHNKINLNKYTKYFNLSIIRGTNKAIKAVKKEKLKFRYNKFFPDMNSF